MLGWFQSTFSLALILGPVLGGLVFDMVAPQAVFAGSAGLMAITVVLRGVILAAFITNPTLAFCGTEKHT